ncbi:MAG: transcription elongation factor GreA, partial [Rickettsiales bacterium]|nr:transcription elongation factor GreA [Rickettsiales bacterium]
MVDKFPITTDGYERMQEELKHLKNVARPSIIKEIAEARAHGDLSENAEYHAAREKQSFNEGRINELEDQVARANVIDINKLSGDNVTFGATVTIIDDDEKEFTYQIVSPYEADLEQGKISITSPIARGLI